MLRMSPQAMPDLYGKDLIAFGTGTIGKRMIPFLAQDPTIKLHGVTNSRITVDDDGTFLETGLPVRSIQAWARLLPSATILVTSFTGIEEITAVCKEAGFQELQLITWEMMNAFIKMEDQIAQSQMSKIFGHLCLANELHDAHKAAFSEFKGCNKGKTVAVVGTGSSLKYYTQIPEVSHIGVNASFLKEDLVLDYYFLTHYEPEWCEKLKNYDFVKFFGMTTNCNSKDQFPEYIIEENGGRRFFSMLTVPGTQVHTDIEYYPLMAYNSIIFRAIHFALYTRPKKLLLVGCDCALNGYYNEETLTDEEKQVDYLAQIQIPQWIDGYHNVKEFAKVHYPDTEIISVNPVELKGLFHDVYTKSYLEGHPELNQNECQLLDKVIKCNEVKRINRVYN